MSDLQDICAEVKAISGDINSMAQRLHAEARRLRQAAARAAATTKGSSSSQARRTAQALQNAADRCEQAAQQLHAAEGAGTLFVKRNCGSA